MRILFATDIHASRRALDLIPAAIREHTPDLFLACGDLTHGGPVRRVAVPGTCPPPQVLDVLEELGVNIHLRKTTIQGHTIVGLGGSNPTPFGTPFDLEGAEVWRG